MATISIVVPVYNVEKYVEKCLGSLCGQTFADLEIICVDDASSDRSLEIVMHMAKTDSRIQVIRHSENMGTLRARKHGVEKAAGKYIMFVDSDDWLEAEACEKLYQRMEEDPVDILQYGTNVIAAVPMSDAMIHWIKNFLKPYPQKLEKPDILKAVFLEDKFDFNITDKIWNAELCKKAFSKIQNARMIASEDRYAFFILAYYADTYLGIDNAEFYNYNVGIGVTGGDTLDLVRFDKRCSGAKAAELVKEFLQSENTLDVYAEECRQFENKILWDCVDCWFEKLEPELSGEGYDILLKYWKADQILSAIARVYFERQAEVEAKAENSQMISSGKAVGIYHRYMGCTRIRDAILDEKKLAESMGKNVVLLSDEDSPLHVDGRQQAILLPASKDANWDQYEKRAKELKKVLTEENVGIVIYASPTSHIAWLDTLLIRSMGIQVFYLSDKIETEKIEQVDKLRRQEEEAEKRYQELLHSKTYRAGAAVLWLPKMIKRLRGRLWN